MDNQNNIVNNDWILNEHPLLNPLIMTHVLKYLEPMMTSSDRARFRAVCSSWNRLSFNNWRAAANLRLGPPTLQTETRSRAKKAQQSESNSSPEKKYLPINMYLNMVQNPTDPYKLKTKPYSNYTIFGVTFGGKKGTFANMINGKKRHDGREDFWGIIGPLATKSITFEKCTFPGDRLDIFERILADKLTSTLKLVLTDNILSSEKKMNAPSLVVEQWRPRFTGLKVLEVTGETPMDEFILLLESPNVEELKVRNSKFDYLRFCSLLTICIRRNRRVSFKIKKLDVMDSRFFSSIWYLVGNHLFQYSLPLEYVSLNLEPMDSYSTQKYIPNFHYDINQDIYRIFTPILRRNAATLKVMKAFRPPVFEVPLSHFKTRMPQLTELHLWGNIMPDFSFLMFTPNLKVLYLNPCCMDKMDQLKSLFYPKATVAERCIFRERYKPFNKDLILSTAVYYDERIKLLAMEKLHLDCKISRKTVQLLAKWMPHLKSFRGKFERESFRAVCEFFPGLDELGLLFGSVMDNDVFTGEKHGGEIRNPFNITALKGLKRFQSYSYCGRGRFKDSAVLRGFLQLNCLESVRICVSRQFSAEAEAALQRHVANVHIIRNYNKAKQIHEKWECCRRINFYKNVIKTRFY